MSCPFHDTSDHIAEGFFEKPPRARLTIEGKDYEATMKLTENERPVEGQYFAISRDGKILLCECRWTKEEIDAAKERAQELWKRLQWE